MIKEAQIMKDYVMEVLEYAKVKEEMKNYVVSHATALIIDGLEPMLDINKIEHKMNETTEARRILEINSSIPLSALENIDLKTLLIEGRVMSPEELIAIKIMLFQVGRLKRFMTSMQSIAPKISSYALSMFELPEVYDELDRCLGNGSVEDHASPELSRLRKKIRVNEDRIKQKLNSIIASTTYAPYIQEAIVTSRNGRFVIPVKREYRKHLPGKIQDVSSSGSTLYIEPAAIAAYQEELDILIMQEAQEVWNILNTLTGMVRLHQRELSINMEAMIHYDFIFARAKYSQAIKGRAVGINKSNIINIKGGRHPLLGTKAVPLDFSIGRDYRALVITGPNTGGKTVTLKTVGLLTLMVQSGLHVPVEAGSEFAVFDSILADIGDGQSIEQSLSTFSSHVKNLVDIIHEANTHSLVIMDEIGAGTEPAEGMGFAIAVLEEVFAKGATIIASTHISEIKQFAVSTPDFENACMEFDLEILQPLYKLKIGQAGASNAFLIALRLGVDGRIIERAHEITYKEKKAYRAPIILGPEAPVEKVEPEKVEKELLLNTRPPQKPRKKKEKRFQKGDCVFISTMQRYGIVYEPENSRGEVIVMVMKKKYKINHKRLTLQVEAQELYPENYDLDIVFESKENRKKRKQLSKHHLEGVIIETPAEAWDD
jgi:DNA mismatch repair protein MutS2